MCGIAGFNFSQDENIDGRLLSRHLLLEIVKRGRDATGCAYLNTETQKITIRKGPVSAVKFFKTIEKMPEDVSNAILHTRWATKGDPKFNGNNHPIISGKVVGIHNGHLRNDDEIFTHMRSVERRAQVDSEAAFALLGATKFHPVDVLGSLKGRAALAWLDVRDRHALHLARCEHSPLAIGQTKRGSLIFASTMEHLQNSVTYAGIKLKWADEIDEGTYLKVKHGVIHEFLDIGDSMKDVA